MEVVSRRGTGNLLVKVVGTTLVDLEDVRGALVAGVESQINLLWGLAPPPSLIPLRNDSVMRPPGFWGSFRA